MDSLKTIKSENYKDLLLEIIKLWIPTMLSCLCTLVVETINIHFVGHLGDEFLVSGVALATIYLYAFGITIILGFNSVVATLVSKSFGEGNLKQCGIYLNQGRIVIFILSFPMTLLMLLSGVIFGSLNYDHRIVENASHYLFLLIPHLFLYGQHDVVSKYLGCFSKANIVMTISSFTLFIHYCLCYGFTHFLGLGISGIALSTNLNSLLNLVLLWLWVSLKEKDLYDSWFLPNRECFENLQQYFRIGLSSCLLMSLEYFCYDSQTFIGSFISPQSTGVQSIVLNSMFILYTFTCGLQYTCQVLIGISVGERNLNKAFKFRKILIILGFSLATLNSLALFTLRKYIAKFYTNIEILQHMVMDTLSFVAFVEFFSCCQSWLQGLLKGLGKFNDAIFGMMIAFYVISIPLGLFLAFKAELGLFGLWTGLFIGMFLLTTFYLYLILIHYNWKRDIFGRAYPKSKGTRIHLEELIVDIDKESLQLSYEDIQKDIQTKQ